MQAGDVQIASVSGGVQNNVIPAESAAIIWVRPDEADAIERAVLALATDIKREFRSADPDLRIETKRPGTRVERVLSKRAAASLVQAIALLPNGIQNQNLEVAGNWETSNNIGLMVTTEKGVEITSTITSAVTSRKHAVLEQMILLAEIAGDGVTVHDPEGGVAAKEKRDAVGALRGEQGFPVAALLHPVMGAPVVEPRGAEHPDHELAAHRFGAPHQRVPLGLQRHEIRHFRHAVVE